MRCNSTYNALLKSLYYPWVTSFPVIKGLQSDREDSLTTQLRQNKKNNQKGQKNVKKKNNLDLRNSFETVKTHE